MASSSSSIPVKHELQDGDLSADRKKKQKTGELLPPFGVLLCELELTSSFLPLVPRPFLFQPSSTLSPQTQVEEVTATRSLRMLFRL